MTTNDYSGYFSGGYYLVKRFKRTPDVAPELPDVLVSLSNCFTDLAPDEWVLRSWGWELEHIAEDAGVFGIPKDLIVPMLDWCTQEKLNDHPTSFRTADFAIEFHRRFVRAEDVVALGIGLHRDLVDSFYQQLDKDPNRGYALVEQLDRKEILSPKGNRLGFEPLGFAGTHFHSWLCHNAPPEVKRTLAIQTNDHGMISDLRDATRATEHLVATGAEPAIWEPWLIVQYEMAH
ncbi:MAG TPA: hypothetical protein VMU28_01420 [Terriglobales bacterium]|nr:hypothetical protein [Terriglobales bacterium]